jgi:pteridine reductase
MPTPKRVALVTGGAKRVGRAIVERLATSGFDVAFTYFTSGAEANDLARSLSNANQKVIAISADLQSPDAPQLIAKAIDHEFFRLDVLVNNASLYLPGTLQQTTPELIRKLMTIHMEAPLGLCQQFESKLRASRGHVINMCDLLAERPWPEFLAYCSSKAALSSLTLGLARSLAPEVTVNAISPGVVEWPPGYPKSDQEKYLTGVPLNRAGTPEDVANLIHFLATEGNYITGQIIRLDGGRSIT